MGYGGRRGEGEEETGLGAGWVGAWGVQQRSEEGWGGKSVSGGEGPGRHT